MKAIQLARRFAFFFCFPFVCFTANAQLVTNVVFSDNFESGTTVANWTTTGTSPLDPSTVTNAVPPSPTGVWSAYLNTSADRMHRNLIADNGGQEVNGRA